MNIPDTLTLAESFMQTAKDPKYSELAAKARIAVVLDQIKKAAIADIEAPLKEMRRAGCAVALRYEPNGWQADALVPHDESAQEISGGGWTAAEAVAKLYAEWLHLIQPAAEAA